MFTSNVKLKVNQTNKISFNMTYFFYLQSGAEKLNLLMKKDI